ncbi:MAG: endonuclease [Candidatus Aenigmarchaeota archaeon]|nr:endonuclease [Candidatus Aenigmarchaeota archaeon]
MADGLLIAAVVLLVIVLIATLKNNISLRFRLRSGAVKHGKTMEQLMPFSKGYPYDPRGFRFIGDPIDGVQFNEDGVVFVEFKTGNASLSARQKKIKENIEKKRVEFKEMNS